MTVNKKGNPIGYYLHEQIKELWKDDNPLSEVENEFGLFVNAKKSEKQAEHAFDAIKKLMGSTLVEDGLCVGVLKNWKQLERVLYATDEEYRDHFLHPFNTYLLGLIIGKHMGIFDEVENLEAWQYAAFFHDVGYPVEKAKAISESIRETYFKSIPEFTISDIQVTSPRPALLSETHDCISQISGGFVGKLGGGYKSGQPNAEAIFQKGLLNNDHGVVSAIIFWNFAFLDALQIDRKETLDIVRKSVTAMALHNLHWTFPGLRIRADKLPLPFLLALCDELQEWGRPTIADLFRDPDIKDSPDATGWKFLKELEIKREDKSIIITYSPERECKSGTERLFENLTHLFEEVFLPGTHNNIEKFEISVNGDTFPAEIDEKKYIVKNPFRND